MPVGWFGWFGFVVSSASLLGIQVFGQTEVAKLGFCAAIQVFCIPEYLNSEYLLLPIIK